MGMRIWIAGLLLGAAVCVSLTPPDTAAADDGERGPKGPCVKSRAEARYSGYGYDHLVHIENACQQDMHCLVTTSANAEGVSADVPAGESRTVITRRGSPAREFSHALKCAPK